MAGTQTVIRESEMDLVVRDVRSVARDVVALTLAHPAGAELPVWTPGAHIDLILGANLVRQYSLCGRSGQPDAWRVAVLREQRGRGGSRAVHALYAGATVRVRGPRNHFPVEAATRYIFVAGGIGITPLLAMIYELEAAGADWVLHYGGRSRASMAFLDELAQFGSRVRLWPADEVGLIDLDAALGEAQPGTHIYACGPEPLLSAIEKRCGAGWPPGSLHLERFSAKEVEKPAREKGFEVELRRSGKTLAVAADQSVFDAVRGVGVSVLGSCLEGICGTCETPVLDGDVDHRDSVLDDEERAANDCMMICVSRCRSERLVLDL
jgi:ferredoxin-NADP reductase